MSDSLGPHGLYSPWNSPGQNSGVGAAAAVTKSFQSCPTLCDPIDGSPPRSPIPGILQARTPEWVAFPFSRGSSQPRDRTQVSCTAGRFSEPPGNPKNTGVGNLSLLQGIFPTQESNWGLLHCRRISQLYQLSYQGSPTTDEWINKM